MVDAGISVIKQNSKSYRIQINAGYAKGLLFKVNEIRFAGTASTQSSVKRRYGK